MNKPLQTYLDMNYGLFSRKENVLRTWADFKILAPHSFKIRIRIEANLMYSRSYCVSFVCHSYRKDSALNVLDYFHCLLQKRVIDLPSVSKLKYRVTQKKVTRPNFLERKVRGLFKCFRRCSVAKRLIRVISIFRNVFYIVRFPN